MWFQGRRKYLKSQINEEKIVYSLTAEEDVKEKSSRHLSGEEDKTRYLKKISIIPLSQNISPFQKDA